jgi:hypothetical protein
MAKLNLKVAVSTGLYGIARGEELATLIRKVGYALTRGTSAIEIAGDVPHEIDFTEGQEVRYIAKKQGLDLNLHGSLTIPFEIPEMVQWREAQDHIHKSIKSAVYGGCKYVDFHACLHFWVEMLTYTGSRLEIMMCDWDGTFISDLLYKCPEVRRFFVRHYWEKYGYSIFGEKMRTISFNAEEEARRMALDEIRQETGMDKFPPEYIMRLPDYNKKVEKKHLEILPEFIRKHLEEKLGNDDEKGREWYFMAKERGDYVDVCSIIAHYLFLKQDPIWIDMVKMYENELKKYIKLFGPITPSNEDWLFNSFKRSTDDGDRLFKEFYYGAVSAKMMQGHLIALARWMAETNNFKGNGLPSMISNELNIIKPRELERVKKELMDVLKNLKIAIESPDARDPSYAGRYMLWRTKQIYVAVKHTREELKKEGNPYWDKMMLLIDFEHIATQGIDPLEELTDLTKRVPDIGKYIICVHSNRPSPLHSHFPIELGDDLVYRLLWILAKAGLGRDQVTYILFERGGFKDPFAQSVTTLKLIVRFLEKDIPPDKLPDEFYGVYPRGLLSEERQWVSIFQHMMDPLRGTLKVPEEEYTFLSRASMEEGKKPEEWKKEEFR